MDSALEKSRRELCNCSDGISDTRIVHMLFAQSSIHATIFKASQAAGVISIRGGNYLAGIAQRPLEWSDGRHDVFAPGILDRQILYTRLEFLDPAFGEGDMNRSRP